MQEIEEVVMKQNCHLRDTDIFYSIWNSRNSKKIPIVDTVVTQEQEKTSLILELF